MAPPLPLTHNGTCQGVSAGRQEMARRPHPGAGRAGVQRALLYGFYLPAFHVPLPVSSSSVPAGTVKPSLNCHVNWRVTLHTRLILQSPIHAIHLSPTQASKCLPSSHALRSPVTSHTVFSCTTMSSESHSVLLIPPPHVSRSLSAFVTTGACTLPFLCSKVCIFANACWSVYRSGSHMSSVTYVFCFLLHGSTVFFFFFVTWLILNMEP